MTNIGFESVVSPTQNQSSPFSISDILSKEKIGSKKSPTSHYAIPFSTTPVSSGTTTSRLPPPSMFGQEAANMAKRSSAETPKRPRKASSSHGASRHHHQHPKLSLTEAAGVVAPSSSGVVGGQQQGSYVPQTVTPHKPPKSSQINASLISPFNANLLLALGQRPSPGSEEKEELFGESSLGMLSEVAQYHSELSGAEANSSLEAPVREKMANIRLVSTDCSDLMPHEASKGEARNASLIARKHRKASTPGILKRDKRKRVLSASQSSSDECSSAASRHALNTGFASPLSNEKSSSGKELGFSPSIFLSRPPRPRSLSSPDHHTHHSHHGSSSSATPSIPVPLRSEVAPPPAAPSSLSVRFSVSPGSESDCVHSDVDSSSGGNFATSTPIKTHGKENVGGRGSDSEEAWSPTILLNNKRRRHLRETNESSSGSESEGVKKPCLHAATSHRRKSKARTKLSPLLENACSPISKDPSTQHQPSPLTTALATTPTSGDVTTPTTDLDISTAQPSSSSSAPHLATPTSNAHLHAPPPPPQQQQQAFLGSGLLAAGGVGVAPPNTPSQKFLSAAAVAATPITRPFSAVSALLPLPTTQLPPPPQGHQNLLIQQNPLSRLQASFPYNPQLVSATMCAATSPLQRYANTIIPSTIHSYFPLVGLVAPPPANVVAPPPSHHRHPHHHHPAASYLSYSNPYSTSEPHLLPMNSSYDGSGRGYGGSRSVSMDESRRDSKQMRSVPPWFIFSNNRSEKRSRLTEAINKSLSETPIQTRKLPAEWTKLACGQTNDQKQLTEKARYFMRCQPRHLSFSDDMDS